MSKKTLLNEASIRKFMKFAKIDHYTDSFINETYAPMEEGEHEDKMEEGMHADDKMEEGMYTEEEDDESPAPPADDAPPADVDPMPSDDGAMEGTVDLESFMSAFETALEQTTGEDVQVDMDGMDGIDGMDDEVGGDEGPMDDEDADDEVAGEMDLVDDEEVLEETLRRVSARLNRMVETKKTSARKSRMVESVTDRIMARIQKGE